MGSCFGTLKTESLHRYRFTTREQARQTLGSRAPLTACVGSGTC
jgi:hypothetical protein